MRKRRSLFYHVSLFVLAQLTWLVVLGLWIYWYVSNYIIFQRVGERISPQLIAGRTGYFALVTGLVLLVTITVLLSMIFKYLYGQVMLHRRYGAFIANVSHELKSPLSSMQLHLETLSLRKMSAAQQRVFLSLLLEDVSRLSGLVSTILEISGLEQNRNLYRYSVQPMDILVDNMVGEVMDVFGLPQGSIRVAGETHCACVVDLGAMQTIINNFVDNAIKYSPRPVRIFIRLKTTGKRFILEFKDHGIGITEAEQKNVFDKFYRVADRSSPTVKGIGLGLYRVREIARSHGGRVSIAGSTAGKGTTFRLELPIYGVSRKKLTRKLLRITRRKQMENGHG